MSDEMITMAYDRLLDENKTLKTELTAVKSVTYCLYCGFEVSIVDRDKAREIITNHIEICTEHPIHKAAQQVAELMEKNGRLKKLYKEAISLSADRHLANERLRGLLREVEWGQYWPATSVSKEQSACPLCEKMESEGHKPENCRLSAALKETK